MSIHVAVQNPVRARARQATPEELATIDWLKVLSPSDRAWVERELQVAEAAPGERICRLGGAPNFWFGVLDGLLKMSNDSRGGQSISYVGVPAGTWFGEGTLLKNENYRYNIEALRHSLVAGLPAPAFHRLLDVSLAFNRVLMNQLNDRLGQFIAAREIDRSDNPDQRVAATLLHLFHPQRQPDAGSLLRITQQELAYLAGLSRQRVNLALQVLAARGCIAVEYGGVRVLDLPGLRQFAFGA